MILFCAPTRSIVRTEKSEILGIFNFVRKKKAKRSHAGVIGSSGMPRIRPRVEERNIRSCADARPNDIKYTYLNSLHTE